MWREIKKILNQYHKFIITTHIHPDGDGIGAASALIRLLQLLGKKSRFICDSPIPKKYLFLDYERNFEIYNPQVTEIDEGEVLIVLDANKKERIGRLFDAAIDKNLIMICIDHHPIDHPFTPYYAIDTTASATGTLVYTLFKECGFKLDIEAATGIYTSIICDTGRFSYPSTTRKAHKIADECIKIGVDPDLIYDRLFQHVPLEQVKIFARTLERLETFCDGRLLVQEIRKEDYEQLGLNSSDLEHIDLEYMLEFSKTIDNVQCVVLFRELPNDWIRVSIRSKTDLDISNIVKELGGGGHAKAAGATVQGQLDHIKLLVMNKLYALVEGMRVERAERII